MMINIQEKTLIILVEFEQTKYIHIFKNEII